jgi:triacylglycerol esterase/lipase EstA (alpha/beta hydrolase family)
VSLAALLRLQLLAELLIYLALGWLLVTRHGWSAGQAAALAVALFLVLRALLVCATFALSWHWRSPRAPGERIGFAAACRVWLREWWAMVLLFGLVQPFAHGFAPANDLPRGRLPVLLLHGYLCNRGFWFRFQRRLLDLGYGACSIDLGPALASIDRHAERIERQVEAMLAASGAQRVAIVAHSMGGLAARAWIVQGGGARLARLITIGTPHQGSDIARLGPGECARQMRPGSPWLHRLAQDWARADRRDEVLSIYSLHDNFVAPQANQHLPGAHNLPIAGLGHLSMPQDAGVFDAVLQALGPPRLYR